MTSQKLAGGIPPSAIEFFTELTANDQSNNNKVWWAENKHRYEANVRNPFLALLSELGPGYEPWRVYRPHRDTRFATDKAPYKDFIGAVSQLPTGNGIFVQISARGLLLGTGYPMMAPDQLQTFRAAIDDETTGSTFVDLLSAIDIVATAGRYEPLKRNPKGFPSDHPRGTWLRWKGVEIAQRVGTPSWLDTAEASAAIRQLLRNGEPITNWLDSHVGPSALTPEEIWGR
jgi:uncharacterized protein (TIGR02453 family)